MKSTGKIFLILIVLFLVIMGIWYFNNAFLGNSANQKNVSPIKVEKVANSELVLTDQKIILASGNGIIELNPKGGSQKTLFTDKDETDKIQKIGGFAPIANELFVVASESNNLDAIALDGSGKFKELVKSFGIPNDFKPSPDGKLVALTNFSNAERDYGFTLSGMDRDGSNAHELIKNEQEIGNLVWGGDASKIYYTLVKNGSTEIGSFDLKTGKQATLYTTDKSIQSLSYSQDKLYYSQSSSNAGGSQVFELSATGESKKLFESSGLAKNIQISADRINILYSTETELFIADLSGKNAKKLASNVKIYKWK